MDWLRRFLRAGHIDLPPEPAPPPPDPTADFSDADISRAALEYVYGACSSSESWCGGTIAACDRSDEQIAAYRARYADFEPRRVRKAIMAWLDYYQDRNDKNRRDVETQESRHRLDAYSARIDEENRRSRALLDELPPKARA